MKDESIRILAKWSVNKGCYLYNDPDLEILYSLDEIGGKVYEENRIKAPGGFSEASEMAFAAVVKRIIELETETK